MCRCSNDALPEGPGAKNAAAMNPAGSPFLLRPHHGMCLAYFIGKGYSGGFSAHMKQMLSVLLTDLPVRLTVSTDRICEACPNNCGGICTSRTKVEKYDRSVLKACRLKEGEVLSFFEFAKTVQKNVIDCGMRRKICGGCQWSDICDTQKSRWENMAKSSFLNF